AVAEIAVGEATVDKDKFVIDDAEVKSLVGPQKSLSSELIEILRNDFVFYKHKFNNVDYSDKGQASYSNPNLTKWKESGISYFVASQISSSGSGIEAKFKVWSILTGKEIFNQGFTLDQKSIRQKSHQIADAIYRSVTGKASIFNSKIVFISDRGTHGKDTIKELYIMDFDGNRVEKLTDFRSVVLSPSVAPDNSKIMFSVIATHKEVSRSKVRNIKNIDLKMLDLKTKTFTTISDKPGINSGAIFSSSGQSIYTTLSFKGNADIYEMKLGSGTTRNVTSHYADDVDPSITRDGSLMAFLSNRPGRAHIYTMDPAAPDKGVKRISFVGQFNAAPRFSPDGKDIVFSSWVDAGFDLYRISSDGNNLVRLTKDFGSNEEAAYSPDGEFIVFTSKRVLSRTKAVQDIYIMNRDGEILGQLTQDFGRCYSSQWTN
ncbi:MAG: PD40 domain-containing protein, partial [Bdellovibrionales bacterium]|nr:PD40 domain-containing protein [Bdellovibrionales bacterium]